MNSLIPFSTRHRLFDDFRKEMDNVLSRFFSTENSAELTQAATWNPRLNLSETDTQYELSVDLSGVKPDDIHVELRNGELWITGERRSESDDSGKTWHRVEQFYGQFRRMVRLGDDVDPEHVNAEYKDGILHITVPKNEEVKPKKIEIKT